MSKPSAAASAYANTLAKASVPERAAAVKPAALDSAAKRRGPGRPSTKLPPPPLEKKGIVSQPSDPDNRLEFVYETPTIFKQLFTYFKNIKARDIYLRCSRDRLTFFTRDHTKSSRVVAVISGSHVNWHYVEGEFWLGINRENVDHMFKAIDKSFFKITISQTHDDKESLTFIFKDGEIDKDCNYKVTLSTFEPDEDLFDAEKDLDAQSLADLFPVKFTLSAQKFKKSISDVTCTQSVTYEKIGLQPLQLTYNRPEAVYHEVYRDDDKILLDSSVPPGRTFRTTISITNIRSLASSMVTDDVRICCREDADMLFRSAIDKKALVVSTLIKLA